MLTMAVPDLITNSYFPAVAAVELGFFEREGLAVELKHIFPVSKCCEMMRDGEVDLVAGSAHAALAAFPGWRGAKLLAALSQGMYWLLVARQDLDAELVSIAGHYRVAEGLPDDHRRKAVHITLDGDAMRFTGL